MSVKKYLEDAGKKYMNGDGKGAEALYLKAAAMGSAQAAHNLGVLYRAGGSGIEADATKSQYWLTISAKSGYEGTVSSNPEWFRKR